MGKVSQRFIAFLLGGLLITLHSLAYAQSGEQIFDIPTRNGVTNRIMVLSPPHPQATLILMAGGHGGLQLQPNGSFKWGSGNFLVRSRQLFAQEGVAVIVVDAPSDRQVAPFLMGFRQSVEHAEDLRAVISWARDHWQVPVWVVGTSNGTLSAVWVATQLQGQDAPNGIVLTSSVLRLPSRRGPSVPEMALGSIHIPVLVVHHERDACEWCPFSQIQSLMDKLKAVTQAELITFTTGLAWGGPCESFHYHGFNAIEPEVTHRIVQWIASR
jgi:pimeloyl-ACP methyl ester carboxylesterase